MPEENRQLFPHTAPAEEYRAEEVALAEYFRASRAGYLLVGALAVFVLSGVWTWRTLAVLFGFLITLPIMHRILVAFLVWPIECNYRRLVGQFHDGYLPPAIKPEASYWPVSVWRKAAPIILAVGWAWALIKMAQFLGL